MTDPPPPSAGLGLAWPVGFAQLLTWGVFYYALPVFVAPISSDLGWNRELIFAGLSAALLTAVLAAPFVGREIDRGRGRRAMLAGQLVGTLAVAALAIVESAGLFLLLCCVIGLAQAATLYDAAFAFLHRRLGPAAPPAILRVTLIAGFSGTIFVPAAQFGVDQLGWRGAALLLAGAGLLALLLTARCIGVEPEMRDDGQFAAASGGEAREQWTPAMKAAILAFALGTGVFSTITIHFLPLLIDRGIEGMTAAGFFALVGPSQIAARFLLLLAPPGLPALRYGAPVFLLQAGAVALLIVAGGSALLIFAILFGASSGLLTIVRGLAPAEICERAMIGRLNGAIGALAGLTRAALPALFALGLARLGGSAALAVLLLLSLGGAACFAILGPLERHSKRGRRPAGGQAP